MLRRFRHRQGQAITGQYALVFFVVIAAISAMSIYVRRGIQGRIYSARDNMIDTINTETGLAVAKAYEPYYINRESNRAVTQDDGVGARSGQQWQSIYEQTVVNATSSQ